MSDYVRLNGTSLDVLVQNNNQPARRLHYTALDVLSRVPNEAEPRAHLVALDVVVRVLPGIPINLAQVDATVSSVTVTWGASPHGLPPESYEYKLGESGTIAPASSPLIIHGLPDPGAIYEVFVRSLAGGRHSAWASIKVSPTIIFDISTDRQRRTLSSNLQSKINTLEVSAVRSHRTAEMGFEQGIILRFTNMRRQRRQTTILLERPTTSLTLSARRQRRVTDFSLIKEDNNFLLAATRRRRQSSMLLERPAASISLRPYTRPRRQVKIDVLASTFFLTPNMTRRRREVSIKMGPAAVSIGSPNTLIKRLHTDGVWRPLEIAYHD